MPLEKAQLVGNWEKITDSECSQIYPDKLRFQEGNLYFGESDPSKFAYWDVGTYEVASTQKVKISTANDAIVAYDFDISKNVLTFVDPNRCEFKYRRVE